MSETPAGAVAGDQPDKRLELAYDAAQQRLHLQDSTLASTRTRANYLLATAALIVSFTAGLGLINIDPKKGTVFPISAAAIVVTFVVALGASVVYVIVPAKDWCYTPSAKVILELIDAGADEDSIRRHVAQAMIDGANANASMLVQKQKAFKAAIILLVIEVVLVVGTLSFQMEVLQ